MATEAQAIAAIASAYPTARSTKTDDPWRPDSVFANQEIKRVYVLVIDKGKVARSLTHTLRRTIGAPDSVVDENATLLTDEERTVRERFRSRLRNVVEGRFLQDHRGVRILQEYEPAAALVEMVPMTGSPMNLEYAFVHWDGATLGKLSVLPADVPAHLLAK